MISIPECKINMKTTIDNNTILKNVHKPCGLTFVPVVDENRFQLMMGSGLPVASQGRKASEFDRTVKLAAFPPLILGLEVISLKDEV